MRCTPARATPCEPRLTLCQERSCPSPTVRVIGTGTLGSGLPNGPAGLRRPGSAALDLAWLAAGRLDGFFEFGLSEWDLAAGALLITEAGGLVGDLSGGHKFLESGGIVAGSPKVFKGLLQKIKPHLNDGLRR